MSDGAHRGKLLFHVMHSGVALHPMEEQNLELSRSQTIPAVNSSMALVRSPHTGQGLPSSLAGGFGSPLDRSVALLPSASSASLRQSNIVSSPAASRSIGHSASVSALTYGFPAPVPGAEERVDPLNVSVNPSVARGKKINGTITTSTAQRNDPDDVLVLIAVHLPEKAPHLAHSIGADAALALGDGLRMSTPSRSATLRRFLKCFSMLDNADRAKKGLLQHCMDYCSAFMW